LTKKTRRLTRDYLATIDQVLLSLEQAQRLRAALHRELTDTAKVETPKPESGKHREHTKK
jgi:hypothetical protein